jgi:hypothetical protein
MVGDSIFPGQSTAAVVLGGTRVAQAVMNDTTVRHTNFQRLDETEIEKSRMVFKRVREEV